MEAKFDLFGNPDQPGRGFKGRPAFQVTEKDSNKIKLLLALGWTNTRIAAAIDVSPATLKKHFKAALKFRDEMRDRLDAQRLHLAMEAAMAGNITALKELGKMIEKSDQMGIQRKFDAEPEPKEIVLGKKAAAQKRAETAGQDGAWGGDLNFDGRKN